MVKWRWHLGALALYTALAVVFIDHSVNPNRYLAGVSKDPFIYIWFLAWMPYALAHHLNPLFTTLIWQPAGFNLAWTTSIPFLALLLGLPFTLLFGPVFTYNLLVIIAPIASAWFMYRLCLVITDDARAALLGGILFGFSAYEMAQDTAHLNLSFTFFIPALLWVLLLRLQNKIGRWPTVFLASLCLIGEFLTSSEIFTLIFVFGGIAWLLALYYLPERRAELRRLVLDGLLAAPIVIVMLSPLLWQMFLSRGTIQLPAFWPYYFVADPLNLIAPGNSGFITLFRAKATGGGPEEDAYIGLPLLLILALFAWHQRHTPAGRFLAVLFLCLLVASFGPLLRIAGHRTNIFLPWFVFLHLPLLGMALPARFALFVSLVTAIIAALWLSQAKTQQSRWWRSALSGLACLALLPALHPWTKIPDSKFFAPGEVQAQLGPNPRLLILPFAVRGPSAYWQVENNFGFTQVGGYLGFPSPAMLRFSAVYELEGAMEVPNFPASFTSLCEQTGTQYVVAGPGTPPAMLATLAGLHWPSRQADDVKIFTVPGGDHG
jgi:hypothetical protein